MTTEKLPVNITLIIDRSGSMSSIKNDVIGGINSFYAEQKKVEGEATVTFVQFDNVIETVFKNVDLKEVKDLTASTFVPRGMTALYDAIGMTISAVDSETKNPQIICILTDGEENGSKEYTKEHVKTLIELVKTRGWQVMFLGANIDAMKVGSGLGISSDNTVNYVATPQGAMGSISATSAKFSAMRSSYSSGDADWAVKGGTMTDLYKTKMDEPK